MAARPRPSLLRAASSVHPTRRSITRSRSSRRGRLRLGQQQHRVVPVVSEWFLDSRLRGNERRNWNQAEPAPLASRCCLVAVALCQRGSCCCERRVSVGPFVGQFTESSPPLL